MHFRTHVREAHRDKPGLTSRTEYADGMIEHDAMIGTILKAVDDLGIGNDTIVIYTTDNGPHQNSWPDAGDDAVPQREEHQLGRRVPRAVPDPLAGTDSARLDLERDRQRARLAADLDGGRGRSGHQGQAAQGPSGRKQDASRSISTATTSFRT